MYDWAFKQYLGQFEEALRAHNRQAIKALLTIDQLAAYLQGKRIQLALDNGEIKERRIPNENLKVYTQCLINAAHKPDQQHYCELLLEQLTPQTSETQQIPALPIGLFRQRQGQLGQGLTENNVTYIQNVLCDPAFVSYLKGQPIRIQRLDDEERIKQLPQHKRQNYFTQLVRFLQSGELIRFLPYERRLDYFNALLYSIQQYDEHTEEGPSIQDETIHSDSQSISSQQDWAIVDEFLRTSGVYDEAPHSENVDPQEETPHTEQNEKTHTQLVLNKLKQLLKKVNPDHQAIKELLSDQLVRERLPLSPLERAPLTDMDLYNLLTKAVLLKKNEPILPQKVIEAILVTNKPLRLYLTGHKVDLITHYDDSGDPIETYTQLSDYELIRNISIIFQYKRIHLLKILADDWMDNITQIKQAVKSWGTRDAKLINWLLLSYHLPPVEPDDSKLIQFIMEILQTMDADMINQKYQSNLKKIANEEKKHQSEREMTSLRRSTTLLKSILERQLAQSQPETESMTINQDHQKDLHQCAKLLSTRQLNDEETYALKTILKKAEIRERLISANSTDRHPITQSHLYTLLSKYVIPRKIHRNDFPLSDLQILLKNNPSILAYYTGEYAQFDTMNEPGTISDEDLIKNIKDLYCNPFQKDLMDMFVRGIKNNFKRVKCGIERLIKEEDTAKITTLAKNFLERQWSQRTLNAGPESNLQLALAIRILRLLPNEILEPLCTDYNKKTNTYQRKLNKAKCDGTSTNNARVLKCKYKGAFGLLTKYILTPQDQLVIDSHSDSTDSSRKRAVEDEALDSQQPQKRPRTSNAELMNTYGYWSGSNNQSIQSDKQSISDEPSQTTNTDVYDVANILSQLNELN